METSSGLRLGRSLTILSLTGGGSPPQEKLKCACAILFICITFCSQAANYLDIKGLLDVTCKQVANMIKGKTPDEIRKTFNIKNDFTTAEEEQVRKENEWCEEK